METLEELNKKIAALDEKIIKLEKEYNKKYGTK